MPISKKVDMLLHLVAKAIADEHCANTDNEDDFVGFWQCDGFLILDDVSIRIDELVKEQISNKLLTLTENG